MKKTNIKLLTFAILLITNLLLQTKLFALEEYVPEVIIHAKWGKGPGEFGLYECEEENRFYGPSAFYLDTKGNFYIYDGVNYRVQKFNKDGEIEKVIRLKDEITRTSILCANDKDEIYIDGLFPNEELRVYSKEGNLLRIYTNEELKIDVDECRVDNRGNLYLRDYLRNEPYQEFLLNSSYKLKKSEKGLEGKDIYFYRREKEGEHTQYIEIHKKNLFQCKIKVQLNEKYIGKYKLLGVGFKNMDNQNNIYIGLAYGTGRGPLWSMHQINKYTLDGKLLAEIDLYNLKLEELEYSNDLGIKIDDEGNIYQCFWTVDEGLKLIKWKRKK